MSLRRTPAIVIFFIFFSAGASLLEVSGTTAAMGVEAPVGVTTALDEATASMNNISASEGIADTLFGAFVTAARSMEALGRGVFAGPILLTSAGIPSPIVVFLFAPAAIIVGLDIIHYLTGRGP